MEITKEVIRKLGIISDEGAINASRYLSQMTSKKVKVSIPWISLYPYDKVLSTIGNPGKVVTAVFMEITGEIKGVILILFLRKAALELADLLLAKKEPSKELDELGESALKEATGNILANAYINALADKLRLKILDSIPVLKTDMVSAIMDVVISTYSCKAEQALIMKNNFEIEGRGLKGHVFLLFDPATFGLLVDKLKLCEIKSGDALVCKDKINLKAQE